VPLDGQAYLAVSHFRPAQWTSKRDLVWQTWPESDARLRGADVVGFWLMQVDPLNPDPQIWVFLGFIPIRDDAIPVFDVVTKFSQIGDDPLDLHVKILRGSQTGREDVGEPLAERLEIDRRFESGTGKRIIEHGSHPFEEISSKHHTIAAGGKWPSWPRA
jgi:hypothetical protein